MNRRKFLRCSAASLAAGGLGLGGYTCRIEPRWVEIVERALPIVGLPARLSGRRVVQLSDLHVGPHVGTAYLAECLAQAAQLEPDLLALTGDLVTYRGERQLAQLRTVLRHLPRARLAAVAVLGNHDYGPGWSQPQVAERIREELDRAGVTVLRNQAHSVAGLTLIGLDDLWAHRCAPQQVLHQSVAVPSLVLCHNPDGVDLPGWGDYRGWVLSGHTHGGQCKPPFLPPPILPVRNRRYSSGAISLGDGRQLYINRGLGHSFRVRFNARPELTVFTLRTADAELPPGTA